MPRTIELTDVTVRTASGRALFEGLNLQMDHEHVALVGRNGVGKSTLLSLIAGEETESSGRLRVRSKPHYVPQLDEGSEPLSRGELRRLALEAARTSRAEILLLDEPTLHLDDRAVAWLRAWLAEYPGGVIVASHDRRLLRDLRHFLVLREAGGQYFGGSLDELERHLEHDHRAHEQRYARDLQRLAEREADIAQIARRRDRKKRSGRTRELDRCTPRIRLNQKRGQAQVYQGRLAQIRQQRLDALRDWTAASRRALSVDLDLELTLPALPPASSKPLVSLRGVTARTFERAIFRDLDLGLNRERVAVVGPNGAGKTTLLEIVTRQRKPDSGSVRADLSRIGYIAQGGSNWLLDCSLHEHLRGLSLSDAEVARILVTHRFPLALAERPLRSLSPGERARAALIALFSRPNALELLVLDEPTFSLDLVGLRALRAALCKWPGGLLIASHDREFLAELGIEQTLELAPPHESARSDDFRGVA
ncbi:MAG: ATP-binding cassette domain-containing protein [Myxococcota bacterium]|jgi:ATPase subunit of ABC transporter with duplicated ATPase domains|nr:ATP-binding cassette domain-containing protein [Myxococcota bacterium]